MAEIGTKPEIACLQCGAPTTRRKYCGNACKVAGHRASNPQKAKAYRLAEASLRIPKARYCGCGERLAPRVRICPACKPTKTPITRHCECGAVLSLFAQRCADCRKAKLKESRQRASRSFRKTDLGKSIRRADKARRKALQRGKIEGAERFDPIEVLSRDGWRCHICGISTPKRLRGTHHDQAPELDHIVPLAMGGKHTRLNTACACRRCNITKADKPIGQLRLVA